MGFEKGSSGSWYKNYRAVSMVVLNVDDDAEDREFFRDALREIDSSITCLVAGNAMEALTLLKTRHPLPDFIFLDINMPMMSGWEVLTLLDTLDNHHQIYVVMVTSSIDKADRAKAMAHERVIDYMIKPIIRKKLAALKNAPQLAPFFPK